MGLHEGLKDVAKVVQQADNIKLYQQLLDLSAQALDMQSEISRLTNENEELRKKQDIESKITRHKELYVTLSDDTTVLYCAHCWDNDRKLIQLASDNGHFVCPHCKVEGFYNKEAYGNYKKSLRPTRHRIYAIGD